ncbi:hypothetical protein FO519_002986 [Halicephalobus sp. NKZ332]|nr:hypothetical protein FO519_002986 [Halicephalobus sp. NKZ332]
MEVILDIGQEKQSLAGNYMNEERPPSSNKEAPVPAATTPLPSLPVVIQTRDMDFSDFNSQTVADDLVSNLDESMSMISDDDSQFPFDVGTQMGDDIFPEVAEEAIEVEEVQMTKRQLKLLEKDVNALSATLSNFNVVLFSGEGKSTVTGYSSTLSVAQELNIPLKNIFDKHRAPSVVLADKAASGNVNQPKGEDKSFKEAHLQFQVQAEGTGESKYAHVIAKVQNLNATLDDQIVSYLGPFIQDDKAEEDPLFLELSIERSDIQITNPKKKNPLRIRVGDLAVTDGEEVKK